MKTLFRIITAALLVISVTGCAALNSLGTSVLQGGPSYTASIKQPIPKQEFAAVVGAYGAAQSAVTNYRRFCYSAKLKDLPSAICGKRRAVLKAVQPYDKKAVAAIKAARKFMRDNPTLNAFGAISAARNAVADFQAMVNANNMVVPR